MRVVISAGQPISRDSAEASSHPGSSGNAAYSGVTRMHAQRHPVQYLASKCIVGSREKTSISETMSERCRKHDNGALLRFP